MGNADTLAAQRIISSSFERHFSPKINKEDSVDSLPRKILKILIYFVGILGPGLVLGEIFIFGPNQNLYSLWTVFLLFSPFWIVYGFVSKNKPIAFTYALWFLVGILMFFSS